MSEIVYIMTNPAIPDLIKIGITNTGSAEARRAKLSSNENMPLPFIVYYAAEVENAKHTEDILHKAFGDLRINKNREFFKVSPENITSTVHDKTTILFKDEITSVTGAVKSILDPKKTGNQYNGALFWIYKGETLKERRDRIRGE